MTTTDMGRVPTKGAQFGQMKVRQLRAFAKTAPHSISTWFDLVRNVKARYGILDEDIYGSCIRLNVGYPLVNQYPESAMTNNLVL